MDALKLTPPYLAQATEKVWADGARLPAAPPGHLFPVEAFNRAGLALLGEAWGLNEMRVSDLPLPWLPELPSSAFVGGALIPSALAEMLPLVRDTRAVMAEYLEYEDELLGSQEATLTTSEWRALVQHQSDVRIKWTGARIQRNWVVQYLAERLAAGDVHAVFRRKGGGPPSDVPPEWWQLDNYLPRFRSCGLTPEAPYDPQAPTTHWFFLEQRSLDAVLAPQELEQREVPFASTTFDATHLSPYIQLMIEVAQITNIGPDPSQQVPVESLYITIGEVATKRGIELSGKDVTKMATFVREPGMKAGSRKVMADLKRAPRASA